MKSIQAIVALAIAAAAVSAAPAFAGPNWEVINQARLASTQAHATNAHTDAGQQGMDDACIQMRKNMTSKMAASGGADTTTVNRTASALFGEREPSASATRTVIVSQGVKAIPVLAGETVRFDFGATSGTWHFAPQSIGTAVELGTLFPEIALAHGVWASPHADQFSAGH